MADVMYDPTQPPKSTGGRKTAPPLRDYTNNAAGGGQPSSPDPFGAMGGGVWTGDGWVPRDHPLAGGGGGATPPPPSPPAGGGGAMPPSPAATQPGTPVAGGTPGAISAPPLQDTTNTTRHTAPPLQQQQPLAGGTREQQIAIQNAQAAAFAAGRDPSTLRTAAPGEIAHAQSGAVTQPGVPVAGGTPGAISAPPLTQTPAAAGAPPTSPNPFTSHPAGGVWIPSTQQWVPGDHPLAQTAGAQPQPGAPGQPPPGQPGAPAPPDPLTVPPPPPPGSTTLPAPQIPVGTEAPDPADVAFREALLELLGQDPNDVSLTDADIAPQQRAFQAAQERAALQQRAELMERASAESIADSEATRAAGRAIQERTGQVIGENDAALLTQKMQARRDQLNTAMQIANQRGMQQEANDLAKEIANLDATLKTSEQGLTREGMQMTRDLAQLDTNTKKYLADLDGQLRREGYSTQERLARLDAEVRRYGIDTQGNIGQLELALRRELGIGELNLGFLQTMLQNEQFGNRLGFDIGAFQAGMNRDALLAAMGGA